MRQKNVINLILVKKMLFTDALLAPPRYIAPNANNIRPSANHRGRGARYGGFSIGGRRQTQPGYQYHVTHY